MAKGNWKPDVIKPRTRCRYCGYVLKKNEIRYVGYIPCHAECANKRNLIHTAECTKMTRYLSEEEPTGEITITHEEAMRALEERGLTQRAADVCHESSDGIHQWYQGSTWEICAHCGTRR